MARPALTREMGVYASSGIISVDSPAGIVVGVDASAALDVSGTVFVFLGTEV